MSTRNGGHIGKVRHTTMQCAPTAFKDSLPVSIRQLPHQGLQASLLLLVQSLTDLWVRGHDQGQAVRVVLGEGRRDESDLMK